MSRLSKYYDIALRNADCTYIMHPGRTCGQFAMGNFAKNFGTSAKFYAPLVCIQFLRQIRGFSRETLQDLFQTCFLLTLTTYLGSVCGQSITCILYRLLGRMYLSTAVFIPAFVGNLWGFLMPPKINNYISNGITLLVIEAYFRCGTSLVWQLIESSNLLRTLMFMSMSACILDTRHIVKEQIFWFVKAIPPPSAPPDVAMATSPFMDCVAPATVNCCSHTGPCDSYIIKGIQANVKLGLGLEVARMLLSNLSTLQRSPAHIFHLITGIKLEVILFFVSYTSGYRFLNCTLNRYWKKPTQMANSMAAFLSGATFYMYPNLTILSHGTVTTVKLLWAKYVRANTTKSGVSFGDYIDRLPMSRIFYVLTIGYVFHLRAFYPWMCPNLLLRAAQQTSGNNCDGATTRLSYFLFGNT